MLFVRSVTLALVATAISVATRDARADQVAVLKFARGAGNTTEAQVDAARRATQQAVERTGNALPPTAQAYAADVVVMDGTPDTTDEYRAAGRAAGSRWTIAGRVDAHGWTYRLELEVCQVETGRVESLSREVDLRQPVPQIVEMLALLLRPKGLGDAVPPWEQQGPPPMMPSPTPTPTSTSTSTSTPTPTSTSTSTSTPNLYAHARSFALGAGPELLGAFARAAGATGSPVSAGVTVDTGYAISDLPGFELRGGFGAGLLGPQSLRFDMGARYMMPIGGGESRVYLGPEAAFGGLFVLGGDRDPRIWLRGAIPVAYVVSEQVQLEAYPEVAYAVGGTSALGFVGGGVRAFLRF